VPKSIGHPLTNLDAVRGAGCPLKIWYMVLEGIGDPLTNSSESINNFARQQIFFKGLPISSDLLPEGICYLWCSRQKLLDNL
jgi:hypothetical protein